MNRTVNGNFLKIGATFRHDAEFAPKQRLYQKEATVIESLKMEYFGRCKKLSSQYGPPNYPVSRSDEWGRQWKFTEIRGYLSPWYRVCTKSMFISQGSYQNGEPKNVIIGRVQNAYFTVRASKLPGFMQRRIRQSMEISWKSVLPFAMIPCLHQINVYMKRKLRKWRA